MLSTLHEGFESANLHANFDIVGVVLELALITNIALIFAGRLYRFCLQSDQIVRNGNYSAITG